MQATLLYFTSQDPSNPHPSDEELLDWAITFLRPHLRESSFVWRVACIV